MLGGKLHKAGAEQFARIRGGFGVMKNSYNGQAIPAEGRAIGYSNGELQVPRQADYFRSLKATGTGREYLEGFAAGV